SSAQGANPPASAAQISELKKILNAGVDAQERGDDRDAEKEWTDGLAKAKALGTNTLTGQFLHNLGRLAYDRGSFFKALDFNREALQLRQNLNNQQFIAESLNGIGNDYLGMGRYGEALS